MFVFGRMYLSKFQTQWHLFSMYLLLLFLGCMCICICVFSCQVLEDQLSTDFLSSQKIISFTCSFFYLKQNPPKVFFHNPFLEFCSFLTLILLMYVFLPCSWSHLPRICPCCKTVIFCFAHQSCYFFVFHNILLN